MRKPVPVRLSPAASHLVTEFLKVLDKMVQRRVAQLASRLYIAMLVGELPQRRSQPRARCPLPGCRRRVSVGGVCSDHRDVPPDVVAKFLAESRGDFSHLQAETTARRQKGPRKAVRGRAAATTGLGMI